MAPLGRTKMPEFGQEFGPMDFLSTAAQQRGTVTLGR
jgi:hypothetical protein